MNGQDRRSGRRRAYDIFFKTVVYLSAFLTVALLVVLIGYIFVCRISPDSCSPRRPVCSWIPSAFCQTS